MSGTSRTIHHIFPCALWVLCLLGIGCRSTPRAGPVERGEGRLSPTTAPAVSEYIGPGVRLSYPANGWEVGASDAYAWLLVAGDTHAAVSLDVPMLPPHIPGLIPLGMVVNGYTDDLKTLDPAVKIDPPLDTKVADARARRVRSTRTDSGRPVVETAVLTVHGDRVYIFRANSDVAGEPAAVEVLDGVLTSVAWQWRP